MKNIGNIKTGWVIWQDLTVEEKEQAVSSFISIRGDEEGIPYEDVKYDIGYIKECSFERMEDCYIFVNI